MNDRFKFRIPITNKDGKFEKFVYFDLFNQLAITCRASDIFKNPEQCTGLKDKNGRLIYECDIVRYTFYAQPAVHEKDWKLRGVIRWEIDGFNTRSYADEIEVIGNIHENHEILEDK